MLAVKNEMVHCVIGNRRMGSDPSDLGSDVRPYSLPTTLGTHQELGGYVRAASWGPPSTTMPFTTLPSFLPPIGDATTSTEVGRRPSLTSSLTRPADPAALSSALAVPDLLRQQQSVTCLPSELGVNRFSFQKPSSFFSNDSNIDEIRQSLLSMPSLNSVFATSCNSPFTQPTIFDQSIPSLSDSSHQLPFPSAATSSLQLGTFPAIQPSIDPNFNAVTTTALGHLPLTAPCSENFWQTNSCLPFVNTSLYPYPGNRLVADICQATAATNNNEHEDDSRQDSSLWRPY